MKKIPFIAAGLMLTTLLFGTSNSYIANAKEKDEKPEMIKLKGYYTIEFLHPEDEPEEEIAKRRQFEDRKPEGFRGIKFGTDISTLEDMIFLRKRIIKSYDRPFGKFEWIETGPEWVTDVYARKNENEWIGDEPTNIEYFFSDGKLCYVEMVTFNPDSYRALEKAFVNQFGPPSACEYDTRAPIWIGKKTIVDIKSLRRRYEETPFLTKWAVWYEDRKASGYKEISRYTKVSKAIFEKFYDPDKSDYLPVTKQDVQSEGSDFGEYVFALHTTDYKLEGPTIMRLMTREAAEKLHYRIKIREKVGGGF